MTAFTTIPNSDVDPESPITTSLITSLRDNPVSIAEGDATAPKIQQAALDSSSVGQAQLKTGLQQSTGLLGAGVSSEIGFTGGEYSLGYGISSNIGLGLMPVIAGTGGVYSNEIGVTNTAGTSFSYYFRARYITASKPYNMGDGDVSAYAFLLMNNDGTIEAVDFAPDPIWAYNGPTRTKPDYYKKGRGFILGYNYPSKITSITDRLARKREEITFRKENEPTEREVTQDIKNADMNIIPHPFLGRDLTDKTVVLIDPVSDLTNELFELQCDGENLSSLIYDGYLIIDNKPLNRKGPKVVMPVSARWK